MKQILRTVHITGLLLLSVLVLTANQAVFGTGQSARPLADFDGNGVADLAVGAAYEDLGSTNAAGAVHVLYGAEPGGLSLDGDQVWHQDVGTIHSLCEEYDHFGQVLTAGDFDGDGYDDLAIGVDYKTIDGKAGAGAVHILYGTVAGHDSAHHSQDQLAACLPLSKNQPIGPLARGFYQQGVLIIAALHPVAGLSLAEIPGLLVAGNQAVDGNLHGRIQVPDLLEEIL